MEGPSGGGPCRTPPAEKEHDSVFKPEVIVPDGSPEIPPWWFILLCWMLLLSGVSYAIVSALF